MPPTEGSYRPSPIDPAAFSPGLPQPASPILPPVVASMILEEPSPQSVCPVRRSILKPPTFHFNFLIPPSADHTNRITTPLPRYLTDKIPLELVHCCIDSLRYDKETLRNCALVCKSWLVRARPLLLPKKFTVTVTRQTGSQTFSILTAPGSSLTDFVHTLCIQSSETFPLRSRPFTSGGDDLDTASGHSISFNHYLLPFVGSCHALRNLIFQGIEIPPRAPKPTSAIASQIRALPYLTRLELTRCAFWTFEELLLGICARRSLTELSLADIAILHWLPDKLPPPSLHLPRRLHTLSLNTPGQTLILKWIISRAEMPPLKAVSLGGVKDSHDQRTLDVFLKMLGASLEHLALNLVRSTHGVDLSHNTRLESLSISHYLIGKFASENISPTGGLVQILRQITSPHIARIDLAFVNAPQDLLLMPWAAVAAELDAPKFSDLRLMKMRLAGKKARWDGVLREVFPRLSTNQILKILWDSSA